MRNILYILFTGLISISLWSCSEDVMDEINKNVNDPTDVGSNLIITDAMITSAFTITGSDLAFYSSIYIEHNTGVWNQAYNAEIRSGEPISATTYNNSWNAMYNNLYNLKTIIEKCSEGGDEEGNYHTLGIAQTLMAHDLATLTDLMGDVPWTEALQPGFIFTPSLDKQEAIYNEVHRLLDAAIENFNKSSVFPSLGVQDVIYGGNVANWKKLANGLKARYTMQLSLKSAQYNDVISYAEQSFASPAEQAELNYDGSTSISPFYKFFTDRDYFGASQSLFNKLDDRNDPRIDAFWEAHPSAGGDLELAPNGNPTQVQGFYSISALSSATAPTYLMSYHEVEFLKAEAYTRLGQLEEAAEALENGITAAFEKVGLTAEDAATYFEETVQSKFDSNPLAEVMNQKYIAFFEEEAVQAYNDYRRLVAMGDNVIELENARNDENLFPKRFTYGSSDVTTNVNVREAYGDGRYVYTEDVWWAGGTR